MDPDRNRDLKQRLEALRCKGVLAVACPTCSGEAGFHRAFAWFQGEEARRARNDPDILGISESGGVVVELFPEVFLWTDPDRHEAEGETGHRVGVLHCTHCHHHAKHRLTWPDDLYYRLRVGGAELLAYTREHAEDNLALLQQLRAVPRILRGLLKEEVAARMPLAFLKSENLDPAIRGLGRLLQSTPTDD